jgi:hypothetical protein
MPAIGTPAEKSSSQPQAATPCSHARGMRAEPKGFYSRMFPKPAAPLSAPDEAKLVELGRALRYDVEREGTLTPRIGFTYFGQFLGHDLTHDSTPLAGPYSSPEKTPNFRTAAFDLDHVYGGGPAASPYLYEGEEGAETFKVGASTPGGQARDVPVSHGRLLVGDMEDTRNLDNLLLRQLHAVFLKFHNEAIRQLQTNPAMKRAAEFLGPGTLFERAHRLVCWHYQWIIRHDYLPRMLHNDVWNHQAHRNPPKPGNGFAVPIEFSLAAFRFGHSMVRNAYRLNCRKKRVVIEELMALGQKPDPIPDDYLLEWGTFFDGLPTSGPQASSAFIDTSLSGAMHGLAPEIIRLANRFESAHPANLPVRTLLRGARAQLPCGQEAANALVADGKIRSADRLTYEELTADTCNRSGTVLRELGLVEETPLFYYILKEAELRAGGLTLGPLGSHIISEVIQGALENDPDSYLSVIGPRWQLPTWRFPNGSDRVINSFIGIIRLLGDDKLLPECEAHWRRFHFPAQPA